MLKLVKIRTHLISFLPGVQLCFIGSLMRPLAVSSLFTSGISFVILRIATPLSILGFPLTFQLTTFILFFLYQWEAMRDTLWFDRLIPVSLRGKDYLYLSLSLNHSLSMRIRRIMMKHVELIALSPKLISEGRHIFVFPFSLQCFVLILTILILKIDR
jgi:hypothetical protein